MISIKLITIFLIIKTTTAVDLNGKDEHNHICYKEKKETMLNDDTYIVRIPHCCEGYVQSIDKCVPTCLNCIYGSCVRPEVCECNNGYQMIENLCTPICHQECINGFCNKPEMCGCYEGYELEGKNSTKCLPKCAQKCQKFSTCIRPNICKCNHGYKENKLTKLCEPFCPDMPKNAKCMEPFSWDCNENFRHDLKLNKCILKSCVCNDNGGYCLEHENQCECYKGFEKNITTGECESVCEPQCVNSTCIANNVCQCFDGYHATSEHNICEKNGECNSHLCENGECLSTGECKCKDGFMKSVTYDLQVECVPAGIFVGKLMTLVLGIPLLLALGILLIFYVIARRKTYITNEQPDRELQLLSEMH